MSVIPLRYRRDLAASGVIFSLTGCSNVAILDQSPIENYVVVRIGNDGAAPVQVTLCYAQQCRVHDVTDSINVGDHRDDGVNTAHPGTAIFRVSNQGEVVRCLRVPYTTGQRYATVNVSEARPCPWAG